MGATAKGDNPAGTIGYQSIFACGLTLFVLTLLMNMVAIRFVRKYRRGLRMSAPHSEAIARAVRELVPDQSPLPNRGRRLQGIR